MSPQKQMLLWAALISVAVHVTLGLVLANVRAGAPSPALVDVSVLVDVVEEGETDDGMAHLVASPGVVQASRPHHAESAGATPALRGSPDWIGTTLDPPSIELGDPGTPHSDTSPMASNNPGPGGGSPTSGNAASPGNFFGIASQGQRIVYVLDRSSSMGRGGALEVASRELLASLRSLPPQASFQVIVYHSAAQFLLPQYTGWLTSAQLPQVEAALLALLPEGSTKHHLALPLALSLQPDVIFFLTDADDLPAAYVAEVTARNQGRAIIHTVELTRRHLLQPDMPLQRLARQNRGDYRAVAVGP